MKEPLVAASCAMCCRSGSKLKEGRVILSLKKQKLWKKNQWKKASNQLMCTWMIYQASLVYYFLVKFLILHFFSYYFHLVSFFLVEHMLISIRSWKNKHIHKLLFLNLIRKKTWQIKFRILFIICWNI